MSYDDIINGCRKQDRIAQEAFYDLFAQPLFATSYRLLGDEYEAEEAIQEVLLLPLTQHKHLLDKLTDMERLLRRMTINESVDSLRKRKITWTEWDDGIDIQAENNTEDILISTERYQNLHQAIESLPEKYKTVLLLSVVEDLSYDEIASLLHARPSTIRTQITRAKQKLITKIQYERE